MTNAPPEAARLEGSFRRLAWLVFLSVLAILAALIWREYQLQITRELDLRRSALQERIVGIEAIANAADVHVSSMKIAFENELILGEGIDIMTLPLYRPGASGVITFVPRPDSARRHREGTLFGIPSKLDSRLDKGVEVQAIFDMFRRASAIHTATPYFRWSYFFSDARDLIGIYPYAELDTFLGVENRLATMNGYYDYDVYKLTTKALNPERKSTWTPVYFDAGGSGLMVSHNAPVDVYGIQRGMVGTDVLLATLSDQLAASGSDLVLIVDQASNLVADSLKQASKAKDVTKASAVSPVDLALITGSGFTLSGDHYGLQQPVAGTPWILYAFVAKADVQGEAIQRIIPYLVFLIILAVTMALGYTMIRSGYLKPAFALVANLEQRAAGQEVDPQDIPARWRPWFDRVHDIFRSRDQTVQMLRQAEEKSVSIIRVALDAIVTTDSEGKVVDFNPAAERMFGRSQADVIGKAIGDLIVPPHLRDAHHAGMVRHARTGVSHVLSQRVELDAYHEQGKIFPVEIQIHELKGLASVRYAAYIRDLTNQKAAAAALQDQQEKLYQAEKLTAMGSLLAGLAHELNNPLAVVIAQTSLLEEIAPDQTVKGRATKIRIAAERCGRIVRTFLSMARKETPQRSSVDLRVLVQQSLDVLAYGLKSGGVEVVQRHDPALPLIMADPDQLNQVVINLLVNAQQAFGDRPGVRLVTIATAVDAGGMIRLTLSDNGPGIPDTVISRIFEAFFTTKPVGVGTGIGLAVSRSIIEAHGGKITASNRPEGGAMFTILLPIQTTVDFPAISLKSVEPETRKASDARQLLIVDDEPEVAESLAAYLGLDGHDVTLTHSIPDALAAMQAYAFDAVFCDLRMPGGGGTALWNEVARNNAALGEKFIFVTGDMVAGPETLRGAAHGKTVRILEKPFAREDIRTALDAVLGPPAV